MAQKEWIKEVCLQWHIFLQGNLLDPNHFRYKIRKIPKQKARYFGQLPEKVPI